MFQNKNWLKVLVPELMIVVVILAVFFGYRWSGMEEREATSAAAVAFFAAVFTAIAAAALAAVSTVFVAVLAAVAAAIVAAITPSTFNSAVFAVLGVFAFAVLADVLADVLAEKYKLPKFWVLMSYLVEAAIICIFICYLFSKEG